MDKKGDLAYETLTNLLTNPIKLVKQIDEIHGEGTVKKLTKDDDFDLNSRMINSISSHNKQAVASTGVNREQILTAIQYLQKVKLSESNAKDWDAVNKCKKTTDDVVKMLKK
jgi:hypothetical protein